MAKNYGQIRQRIFKYFMTSILIPLLLLASILCFYLLKNETAAQKNRFSQDVDRLGYNLNALLSSAAQTALSVSRDDSFQELLKEPEDIHTHTGLELEGNRILLNKYHNAAFHIYVLGNNQLLCKSNYLSIRPDTYTQSTWYTAIYENDATLWMTITESSLVANSVPGAYVSLGMPVYDGATSQKLGIVLVEIPILDTVTAYRHDFSSYLYFISPNAELHKNANDFSTNVDTDFFVLDNDKIQTWQNGMKSPDYILTAKQSIRYWSDDFISSGSFSQGKYYFSYTELAVNHWIVVNAMPLSLLYSQEVEVLLLIFLLFLLLVITTLFISHRLSATISLPIETLGQKVQEIGKGQLDITIDNLPNDEIGTLGQQITSMASSIKEQKEQIVREQEQLHHFELMLLQAQINPHFLYNTLDSLQWLIRMQQNETALKMTHALTVFFKSGLNKGRDIIPLEAEFQNAESYLTIQQLRYKSKLHYHVMLDKSLSDVPIPKLVLQPIIENALYHGIKEKEEGGVIDIRAVRTATGITISVLDDGIGMDAATLKTIRNAVYTEQPDSTHYGLHNVHLRLLLYYGIRYQLHIESEKNLGTIITIQITEDIHAENSNC